jgi:PAS domain S-box-containing protein
MPDDSSGARAQPDQREEHFRLLVESVRDYAIFGLDPTGHVTTWNSGAERIKGYTAREIIGQHFSRFYPAEDVASGKCDRELEIAARDGRIEDEGWRIRKDGTRFWANVVITALRGENGELVGFAKVTRDLTERRRAEEDRVARARAEAETRAKDQMMERERAIHREVEASRILVTTTLRSIGDAVICTDANGRITMMNPVAEQLTGWTEADAMGQPLPTVFHIVNSVTRDTVESPVDRVLETGAIVGLANHTTLITRAGKETPIDDSGAPIRDPEGAIRGVVLVFRNATAEKVETLRRAFRAEVAAAVSSSLDSRAVLHHFAQLAVPRLADWCAVDLVEPGGAAPVQVAVAHSDPRKVELAREWATRFPTPADAPRGVPNVLRTGVGELYPEISDELLVSSAQSEEHLQLARTLGLRSAIIAPIRAGARVLGAITLVYAESDRRYDEDDLEFAEELGARAAIALENARLFEQARRSREIADAASRTKDEFLATVSHELRTPLNAILGWAKLLSTRAFDEEKRARAVETIVRNATAMAQLIEDLLDVSRIVSGKLRLEMAPVEIVPIIEAAIDAVRPAAEAKGIQVTTALDSEGRKLVGDAMRLQQIVWNLLANAVKFTPRGGRVAVTLRASGSGLELSVIDDGQGIETSFLPHVFESFRQADASIGRSTGGLGLGLAITKHLVEAHGGIIEAQSAGSGRGATFVVQLPTIASANASGASDSFPPSSPPCLELPAGLRGRRVLIVDDDADTRVVVATALEQCGAEVRMASSAREAMAMFEQEVPDVLVSDIGMPGASGYDLMRQVRGLSPEKGGEVPAAALTAYARAEDRRRALAAGFMSHVPKPVDPAELCAVVAALGRFSKREPVQPT